MPIYIAILCLPVGVVVDVAETAGRPFNWVSVSFLPSYVFRPILILLAISVCVMFGIEANATIAMWCGFFALNVVGILHIAALFKKMRGAVPETKPKYEVSYWIKMALPIFLLEGFFNLQSSADVLLVSFLTNPESAGIYFAAAKILASGPFCRLCGSYRCGTQFFRLSYSRRPGRAGNAFAPRHQDEFYTDLRVCPVPCAGRQISFVTVR